MRRRLALVLVVAILGVVGVIVLAGHDPVGNRYLPKCLFHQVTGWHCAGCGMTRATHALLQFRFLDAFRQNPLVVLCLPVLAYGVVVESAAWVLGDRYRGPRVRLPGWAYWPLIGTILGYWILRNVPAWPFTLLAPH